MTRPSTFTAVAPVTNADSIAMLSCADALQQRNNPVVLFTPALLLTHGGFDRDPVVEFDARFPAPDRDQRPFCVQLTKDHERFFRGLGWHTLPNTTKPVNWDQRVYAIDKRRAAECFSFLSGIAYSKPQQNFYATTFMYGVDIADPTSRKNDRLLIMVVGVVTTASIFLLEPSPLDCPGVRVYPNVDGQLPPILRGRVLFSGLPDEDPLTMRED